MTPPIPCWQAEGYLVARGQAGTIVAPDLKPRAPVASHKPRPGAGTPPSFRPDSPSQIFVTSGYRHTVQLIAHALLKEGDRVWLEDPGYPPTRELLGHMAIAAVPVPVDGEGILVDEGIRTTPSRAAVRS